MDRYSHGIFSLCSGQRTTESRMACMEFGMRMLATAVPQAWDHGCRVFVCGARKCRLSRLQTFRDV